MVASLGSSLEESTPDWSNQNQLHLPFPSALLERAAWDIDSIWQVMFYEWDCFQGES